MCLLITHIVQMIKIDLFNLFYNSWEHTNKHIINVNSIVKYLQRSVLEKYKKDKVALQNAVDDVYMGAKSPWQLQSN